MSNSVTVEVNVYEKDDGNKGKAREETITLRSCWNDMDRIVLCVGGHEYTVMQRSLRDAVDAVRTGVR